MQSTASDFSSTRNAERDMATIGDKIQETANDGVDILKENPVLTLVAVGVLGFALGTLAGRSSVRRRSTLDANWDSLHRAIDTARSGTADKVGSWRKTLKKEGLLPEQIPGRIRRLLASVGE